MIRRQGEHRPKSRKLRWWSILSFHWNKLLLFSCFLNDQILSNGIFFKERFVLSSIFSSREAPSRMEDDFLSKYNFLWDYLLPVTISKVKTPLLKRAFRSVMQRGRGGRERSSQVGIGKLFLYHAIFLRNLPKSWPEIPGCLIFFIPLCKFPKTQPSLFPHPPPTFYLAWPKFRKSYCTTFGVGISIGVGVTKMLEVLRLCDWQGADRLAILPLWQVLYKICVQVWHCFAIFFM